MVNSSSDEKKP